MTAANMIQTAGFAKEVPADLIALAAPIVAAHMSISEHDAAAQLQNGQLQLSQTVAPRLLPLLRALGLGPLIATPRPTALALQVRSTADAARIAPSLAHVLGWPAASVLANLQRSGGIVLDGLSQPQNAELCDRLRSLKGLRVTTEKGPYDLFVTGPVDAASRHALNRFLGVLGAEPCRFSGALAINLTFDQVAQLRTRCDSTVCVALNRAFQRFDLFLTGAAGLPDKDVAGFLSTRADLCGAMVQCVSPLSPLCIEQDLSRSAALQFQADYATIGLTTCAKLRRF